jgi:hypothetical protein
MSRDIFIKNSPLLRWIQITAIDNSGAPFQLSFFCGEMGSKAKGLHGEVILCIVAGVFRDCVSHSATTVDYSTATIQTLEMFKPKRTLA